jgi:hypothetical protein
MIRFMIYHRKCFKYVSNNILRCSLLISLHSLKKSKIKEKQYELGPLSTATGEYTERIIDNKVDA